MPLKLTTSETSTDLTSAVPAGVPSVRHSPYVAAKKTVPPASTNGPGKEPAVVSEVSLMSLTKKAWGFCPPCWPGATETVVTSEVISATTIFKACQDRALESIDDLTWEHERGGALGRGHGGFSMCASSGKTTIGRLNRSEAAVEASIRGDPQTFRGKNPSVRASLSLVLVLAVFHVLAAPVQIASRRSVE